MVLVVELHALGLHLAHREGSLAQRKNQPRRGEQRDQHAKPAADPVAVGHHDDADDDGNGAKQPHDVSRRPAVSLAQIARGLVGSQVVARGLLEALCLANPRPVGARSLPELGGDGRELRAVRTVYRRRGGVDRQWRAAALAEDGLRFRHRPHWFSSKAVL